MSRTILLLTCAGLALLPLGRSEAGKPAPAAPPTISQPRAKVVRLTRALRSARMIVAAKVIRTQPLRTQPAARMVKVPTAKAAVKASSRIQAPRRPGVQQLFSKIPRREHQAMKGLLNNSRLASSVPLRRAVAAYLVLRGLKGAQQLPISTQDLASMSKSPSWTPKRMANLAKVLRRAVLIAEAEGIGAGAAFQKALKAYGVSKKYNNRKICGV